MRIQRAAVEDFRNISGTVELSPHVNVLFGRNGQGKTNFMEALYVACYGRSFRQGRLRDLVRFGQPAARVRLDVEGNEVVTALSMSLTEGSRRFTVGGKENASPVDIAQHLRIVFFGPDDLQLVKGSPSIRRSFLDDAIEVHHPPHGKWTRQYGKLLRERNLLLKGMQDGTPPPGDLLETYEEELAKAGGVVLSNRVRYLREFLPAARDLVLEHTAGALRFDGIYLAGDMTLEEGIGPAEAAALLRARYIEARTDDVRSGSTSAGPHLDDLELLVNGRPARFFASQGEQRQVAVSLKIAQLKLWKERFGIAPVLLLDDVLSELDPVRSELLFTLIVRWKVQTVLTTTVRPDMLCNAGNRFFHVEEGRVFELPGGTA